MKSQTITLLVILAIIVSIVVFAWPEEELDGDNPTAVSPIEGCYVARIQNDVYTLNVEEEEAGDVSGTLEFKNFEKDSSSGDFEGTYESGILFGDYSFTSEGMDSVMEVIFQRTGQDFVRGYGELTSEGTQFADLNNITYDASSPLSLFRKEPCP